MGKHIYDDASKHFQYHRECKGKPFFATAVGKLSRYGQLPQRQKLRTFNGITKGSYVIYNPLIIKNEYQ